jgi:hypothetical protein
MVSTSATMAEFTVRSMAAQPTPISTKAFHSEGVGK